MISVLLVDDHAMVREGLKYYLETEADIEVIGEAGNGKIAAELAANLQPDVILMDLIMSDVDGVEGTRLCLAASPVSKVIVLTSKPEDDMVLPAVRAGALSYLLKDVSAADLSTAIRDAAVGKPRLHPMAVARMLQEVSSGKKDLNKQDQISPREMEVLQLIARGLGNKEISAQLFISERTVKTHVTHLLGKVNLRDRTQLAIYALQNKLV
ncbi:MAG: response regulator transcription factor [Clostridia bacterium]|nr:response regulator transcription factor [Clostridia bacterium]